MTPAEHTAAPAVVALVPLKGGSEHEVTSDDLDRYRLAYPGIDVKAELRRLVLWNLNNPRRRKTERGIRRHINTWLTRAANKRVRSFYDTQEWRAVRYQALKRSGRRCELCGAGGELHVDHVKPRSRFPELALTVANLQVLCRDCNLGKLNCDAIDWRGPGRADPVRQPSRPPTKRGMTGCSNHERQQRSDTAE